MSKSFESTVAVAGVTKTPTDYAFECETTLSYSKGDPIIRITTALPTDITKLLKNPAFTVESDTPAQNGNPRILMGTLPAGYLTFRQGRRGEVAARKAAVASTRKPRRNPFANAARCTFVKDDGSKCGSAALKGSTRCRHHQE